MNIFCFSSLFLILLSGCSIMPSKPYAFRQASAKSWKTVSMDHGRMSIDLPNDSNFQYRKDDENNLLMSLYEVTPIKGMEPRVFCYLELRIGASIIGYITARGGKYDSPNKTYSESLDTINYSYIFRNPSGVDVDCIMRITQIKSLGYAYYKHDRECGNSILSLYQKILWSIKYNGKRVMKANQPSDINLQQIKCDAISVRDKELFEIFWIKNN